MIGCAVALVCTCIIGSIWYSSKVPMGRLWMRRYYPGKTELDIGKEARAALGFSVVAGATMILLLRFLLIDGLHSTSLLDGLKFGVGLSCLTTLLELPHVLFSKRYLDIFLLDQTYNLVVMVAAGLCIIYFG